MAQDDKNHEVLADDVTWKPAWASGFFEKVMEAGRRGGEKSDVIFWIIGSEGNSPAPPKEENKKNESPAPRKDVTVYVETIRDTIKENKK